MTSTDLPRFHPIGFESSRAAERMAEDKLDMLVLTSPENVFYTTGYTALPTSGNPILYALRNRLPFFSLVDADGRVTLLCWGFSAEYVDFGVDELVGFDDLNGALGALGDQLARTVSSSARVGVESSCPYFVQRLIEERLGSTTLVPRADNLIARLRLVKSDKEIAVLTESLAIVEKTVEELYAVLDPNASRLELMCEAKYRMIRNGATGIGHVTFSFGGQNPEIAIDEKLLPGKLVTLDLGADLDGYRSDTRRYAYLGDLPVSLRNEHETMVEIVDSVGAALVPGRTYAEVFRQGVTLFEEHGLNLLGRFSHVGHSIGIETEERWLDDDPEEVIEPGMVINIELYTTGETGEQVGNEETYVVGRDHPTRISRLSRDIRAIG